jgi:uncharacterized repeat protein (TIGR02543 family)
MAIPVTGVVGGVVFLNYTSSSNIFMYYTYDDGSVGTVVAQKSGAYGQNRISITGLTSNKVTIYIGASASTITSLTITTPELINFSATDPFLFYKKSSSLVSAETLISNADLPPYISFNKLYSTFNGSSNTSSIESPYNYKELIDNSKHYCLNAGSNYSIFIGGLSHVKSIRLYGNGNGSEGNIKTTVTKLSGSGNAMSVEDVPFENSKNVIAEYSINLSGLSGYTNDTYYLYTITFTPKSGSYSTSFNLWGLYIEANSSCTSVAAPTGLTCSANSKTSLTFGWTAAENASSYDVTLYSDSECTDQVATANVTSTSKEFTGLTASTTYYCKVQSKGDGSTYCTDGNVTAAVSGTTASKDYTVTAASNNESYGTASAEDSSLDEGETTTITAAAESGYKFRSWAVTGTGSTLSSDTDNPTTLTMGTANATVTATFSALETYTITYNKGANGSGTTISNGNKTEDVDFTLSSKTYTYSGHKQLGWSTTDGGEKAYDLGGTYTANANLNLYPYWVETHTITYNSNGGTGYMLSTTDAGEITLRGNIYTKTGYTFLGWATSQSNADAGIVAYTDKAAYTLDADVTLYAVWAESYCEMVSETSGDAPSVGDAVTMQSGAFGGAVTIESSAGTMSYVSNGFQIGWGAATLNVTLNDYLRPGSVILVALNSNNASNTPGYDLYTSDGTKKIDSFIMSETGTTTFQYKVVADDDLDGTNGFKLVKANNPTIILKSLAVTDCQPGGVINAAGWNTYSSNKKLDLSTISGGTAYVASSTADGKVKMTSCTDIVAAGTGLMIKGTTGDTFTIDATTADATFDGTNLLVGLPNGGTVSANDGNYVFGWADPADPGFYFINSTEPTLGAGKAYLHVDGGIVAARLAISFADDTPTSINSISNHQELNTNDFYYDLQGRKVKNPAKGLYIINGKKVLVGDKH